MATSTLTAPRQQWNNWSPKGVSGNALVDYHNCLRSLGLHNAQPYSPMRYASMLALINCFRWWNYEKRNSWVKYWQWCMNAKEFEWECKSGDQRRPGDCDSITAKQFLDLSCCVPGPGTTLARNPWTLTTKEFIYCWRVLFFAKEFPDADDLAEEEATSTTLAIEMARDFIDEKAREFASEQLREFADKALEYGVSVGSGAAARSVAVAGAEIGSGPPGWLIGAGVFVLDKVGLGIIKRNVLQDIRSKYETDAVRRGICLAALTR